MPPKFLKIAQIDMQSYAPRVEYLATFFARLAAGGYNAVMLAYRDKFPYAWHPPLAASDAYAAADVARIAALARRHGLEVIPLGFQFSHSGDILRHERFKALDGGGGALDLTLDESVETLVNTGAELLDAHPGARLIHCGGDEIGGFGGTPRSGRHIREHGVSDYYVQFVNRLAAAFAKRDARVAIWSDMLIRHPQAIERLDRSVVIFYWDYWGYGERTPFVSIGGGLPDMHLFDRAALDGDLRKLFLAASVKPPSEIPMEHVRRFAAYWDWREGETSARSFPYAAWFRDLGFTVVGAFMTYPEKSAFLPDFLGKLNHVRAFARRLRESGAAGAMASLWQPHWPLLETALPATLAASRILDAPQSPDADVLADTAALLGAPWSADALRGYLGAGRDFEAADTLNPQWNGRMSLAERFAWLRETGAWDADMALCAGSLERVEALRAAWTALPPDAYERFAIDDLAWRARLQIAWNAGARHQAATLAEEGRALENRAGRWAETIYAPAHREALLKSRYQPWRDLLAAMM
jgi:hypothetical protein